MAVDHVKEQTSRVLSSRAASAQYSQVALARKSKTVEGNGTRVNGCSFPTVHHSADGKLNIIGVVDFGVKMFSLNTTVKRRAPMICYT